MANGHLGTRGAKTGYMLLGAAPTIDEYIIALGQPALYYRVEEPASSTTAADYTGARPGAYSGTVTFGVAGPSPGAVQLASGAYLTSSTSPLNIQKGTISFWVKLAAYPTSTTLLFGFVDSSSIFDKTFTISSAGSLVFTANDGSSHSITSTNLGLNRWHNVTAVLNGTTAVLYLDGVSVGSVTCGNTLNSYTSNNNIYIGSGSGSAASSTFPGNIASSVDEIVVWDSIYLTAAQIVGLYDIGRQLITTSNALITQIVADVPLAYNPHAKVTAFKADVVVQYNPHARISNIVLEVLRQSSVATDQSLSHTLSFTQTTVVAAVRSRSISQTLGFTETVVTTHILGGNVYSKSLTDTLSFTATPTGHTGTHWHAQTNTDTLAFTQTTTGVNKGKPVSQTLSFTQTVALQKLYKRSVLQTVNYTETLVKGSGVINVTVRDFFSMADRVTRTIDRTILQSLNYVQTLTTRKGLGASQTLVFTTTVTKRGIFNRRIAQALAFTQTIKHTTPVHLRQTFVINQTVNMGLTITDTCDKGTLGDTALGNYTLGTDCGPGGPNGRGSDTLVYTQSLVLSKVFHRTVEQVLSFYQTVPPMPFIRYQGIVQFLEFKDRDFPRTLPLGNGSGYVFTQPVAIITHAQSVMTLSSQLGVITLPAPQFGDSVKTNDKVTFAKVMSTKTYTYVKRVDRLALKYSFLLGTLKAKELKNYFIANINEYIYLTTWKGEIYIGKFGNNPIDFTTTGRFEYDYESVVADVEFQGVRIHG